MSLDVYLVVKGADVPISQQHIFIRENGQTKEISRDEWNRRYPDREPVAVTASTDTTDKVYHGNITHNLTNMADAAGLYQACWHPEELGITHPSQLILPLAEGLIRLTNDPDKFKSHNPANGWGSYETLCNFVAAYLKACVQYPDAAVSVWR